MADYDGSIRIKTEIESKSAQVQLATLENRIVKTADKIEYLRSKMDSLKDTKIPTQEYAKLQSELDATVKKYEELDEQVNTFQKIGMDSKSEPFRKAQDEAQELYMKIEDIRGAMFELEEAGKAFTLGSDTEKYAQMGQQLGYLENDMDVLVQKEELQKLRLEETKEGYKKLGDTAKKSFKKVDKSVKKTSGLMKTFASRLKGIALSLLIFNWITKAFNGFVSSIKEGFENLYKDNEKYKNSVDELKASVLTLKNAFAAAFRPLVDIAIPYIQKASEYMTKLLDKTGQFIAALTGQKTYTKAIKQTADSFKDAEDAADGYLSPLDEINKYQASNTNEEDQTGLMFEEVPIDNKVLDFIKKIKDYLQPVIDYSQKLKDIFSKGFFDGLGDWEYRWQSIKDSIASIKESLIDIFTDPAVVAAADAWAQSVAYMLGSLVGCKRQVRQCIEK